MDYKKFYLSKTFWFNVVAMALVVFNAVFPEFSDFELDAATASALMAVVNLALRFVTKVPLKL